MFQTELLDLLGIGSDEGDARLFARTGKGHVFGKESITGMNGTSPRLHGSGKHFFAVQVRVLR